MKFANKMVLVPAGRAEPEFDTLSVLDQAMANILKNKSLSTIEKISLYQQVLQKNMAVEARLKQKSVRHYSHELSPQKRSNASYDEVDMKKELSDTKEKLEDLTDISVKLEDLTKEIEEEGYKNTFFLTNEQKKDSISTNKISLDDQKNATFLNDDHKHSSILEAPTYAHITKINDTP